MLYISRRVGLNKWGVMDTEDCKEDIVSLDELTYTVCDLHIDVAGVVTDTLIGKSGYKTKIIRVDVQAGAGSPKAAKLKMLTEVDIRVQGDAITSISWGHVRPGIRPIRLSDYGVDLNDYMFADIRHFFFDGVPVTFILDDKLNVHSKTFRNFRQLECVLDLREVTKPSIAKSVYKETINAGSSTRAEMLRQVLDKPARSNYWCAICILNNGFGFREQPKSIRELYPDEFADIKAGVLREYKNEFVRLMDTYLELCHNGIVSARISQYLDWLNNTSNRWLEDCENFDLLMDKCSTNLFDFLGRYTNCNARAVLRFKNYLMYFEPEDDIKQSVVSFIHRVHKWLRKVSLKF